MSVALAGAWFASAAHAQAQPAPPTGALPPAEDPAPEPPAPSAVPEQPAPPGAQPAPPAAAPPGTAAPAGAAPAGYPAPAYGAGYPPGAAEPPLPPPPPPPEPPRSVSVTMSPLHLIFPVFEAMAEVRVVDHFGISLLGGYGSIKVDGTFETTRFRVFEAGGQLSFYPLEAFDSLVLGAEFLYVNVDTENVDGAEVKGVGQGFAVGPFVGYKLITSGGFTFLAQGGFQYVAVQAEAEDTSGNSASDSDSRFIGLLNLNIGWSF